MYWIHSMNLAHAATLSPLAARLALAVWTRSGGAPYADPPHRYPVQLGTRAQLADMLGVDQATLRRHRESIDQALVEVSPGRFTPSLAWPDPWKSGPRDRQGRPLYVRITPEAVSELVGLAHHAPAQTAAAAFRLACYLLPQLRGRSHGGHRAVACHNDLVCAQLGMAPRTLARAFRLLESRGLVVVLRGRYRRVAVDGGLLGAVPGVWKPTAQTDHPPPRKLITLSFANERENEEQAPRAGAREEAPLAPVACSFSKNEGATVFMDRLPGITKAAAEELAEQAPTKAEAEGWLRQESRVVEDALNPAGLFIAAARAGWSRPGFPSASAVAQEGRGLRADRLPPTAEERAAAAAKAEEDRRRAEHERQEERRRWEERRAAREIEVSQLRKDFEDASPSVKAFEELEGRAIALARECGRGECVYDQAASLAREIGPFLEEERRASSRRGLEAARAANPRLFGRRSVAK